MACRLFKIDRAAPLIVDKNDQLGITYVDFRVAVQPAEDNVFVMQTYLTAPSFGVIPAEAVRQLRYAIVELNTKTGRYGQNTMAHSFLRQITSKEQREEVLQMVTRSIRKLLSEEAPRLIGRTSFASNPPLQALRKYFVVGDVIANCGYSLTNVTFEDGRYSWLHERNV